jgi:Na+/melibiose symporter-like transporter
VFAVAQVLEIAGYLPPLEQAGQLIEQPQSASFLLALRLAFVLIPVVFISFGIIFASRFPLTVEAYKRLEKVLADFRAGREVDESEKQALTQRLIG